ncbi:AraC family ligand binding domain-containing protein [Paraburkholderia dipogonis]|uniref:AraC family ligand binding domain-containing protein n=1 Tax=Paraburkholderia dipogonis TaxID=1211383 RepID=UPI0038BDAB8A
MSEVTEAAIQAKSASAPRFWRDDALPFIEVRSIEDGRDVCYAKHSHETFSIGAVTGGRSEYLNRHAREWIGAGVVVMMNPDDVHACNPVADERWSYRMMHVDVAWLTGLQHELGFGENHAFRAFSQTMTKDAELFDGLNRLHAVLVDRDADMLRKQSAAITFFSEVQNRLNPAVLPDHDASRQLTRAANPCWAPALSATTFTGPGEMELASAKAAMESKAVIGCLDTDARRICDGQRYREEGRRVLKESAMTARIVAIPGLAILAMGDAAPLVREDALADIGSVSDAGADVDGEAMPL